MKVTYLGSRLALVVVVCFAILLVGSGSAVACETCVAPDKNETSYEPFWSNEAFPYDTDENTSFTEIVINETTQEMQEDFGGNNETSDETGASAAAAVSADESGASAGLSISL